MHRDHRSYICRAQYKEHTNIHDSFCTCSQLSVHASAGRVWLMHGLNI